VRSFFICLIIILTCSSLASGLGKTQIELKDHDSIIDLNRRVFIFEDVSGQLTLADIQKPEYQTKFIKSEMDIINFKLSTNWYWIKIDLTDLSTQTKWLLQISEAKIEYADFYFLNEEGNWEIIKNGYDVPLNKKYLRHYFQLFPLTFYRPVSVFYIRTKANLNPIPLTIISEIEREAYQNIKDLLSGLLIGLIFFIVINNFFISVQKRDRTYLLYVFAAISYLGLIISTDGYLKLLFDYNLIVCVSVSALCTEIFAILYAKAFLKINSKGLVGWVLNCFLVLLIAFLLSFLFIKPEQSYLLTQVSSLIFYPLMILTAALSIKREGQYAVLYLIAYLFFTVFGILEVIYINSGQPKYFYLIHGEWGILCEVILLNFALRLQSLNERKQLQLTKDLAQREVIDQIKTKAAFEQKIAKLELNGLRAQMNPHFIFNGLNAINRFMLNANAIEAKEYIEKFARLMHITIEGAKENKIALRDELEFIEIYLFIESIRYQKKFSYEITIGDDVDKNIKIPAMIIHPYVENSIWHGLLHKSEPGIIHISVEYINGFLKFIIEDNGIGRSNSRTRSADELINYKSLGMKLTAELLTTLNRANNQNSTIEVIDLKDTHNEALGTKVILMLQC
jgi:sensor histidine kinase YesM